MTPCPFKLPVTVRETRPIGSIRCWVIEGADGEHVIGVVDQRLSDYLAAALNAYPQAADNALLLRAITCFGADIRVFCGEEFAFVRYSDFIRPGVYLDVRKDGSIKLTPELRAALRKALGETEPAGPAGTPAQLLDSPAGHPETKPIDAPAEGLRDCADAPRGENCSVCGKRPATQPMPLLPTALGFPAACDECVRSFHERFYKPRPESTVRNDADGVGGTRVDAAGNADSSGQDAPATGVAQDAPARVVCSDAHTPSIPAPETDENG